MSDEKRPDPTKGIRKIRDGSYVDWYGHPSTEGAYLAQFQEANLSEFEEVMEQVDAVQEAFEEQPPLKAYLAQIGEDEKVPSRPAREIENSGIPYEGTFLKNGYLWSTSMPRTTQGLIEIKGIGKAGAERIATWTSENWGMEIV